MKHQWLHVDGVRSFDRIHDEDSLYRRVALDGEHLFKLVFRRDSDDARARVIEDVRSLLGCLRGINWNGYRAEAKALRNR